MRPVILNCIYRQKTPQIKQKTQREKSLKFQLLLAQAPKKHSTPKWQYKLHPSQTENSQDRE